jgi:hypothetical protein
MNKRSAMVIAAGLVAALVAGAAAISIGLNSPGAAVAAGVRLTKPDPIVKTVKHTVKVHKKAKHQAGSQVVVVQPSSSGSSSVQSSGSSSVSRESSPSPEPTQSVSPSHSDDDHEGSHDSHEDDGGYDDGGGDD